MSNYGNNRARAVMQYSISLQHHFGSHCIQSIPGDSYVESEVYTI